MLRPIPLQHAARPSATSRAIAHIEFSSYPEFRAYYRAIWRTKALTVRFKYESVAEGQWQIS